MADDHVGGERESRAAQVTLIYFQPPAQGLPFIHTSVWMEVSNFFFVAYSHREALENEDCSDRI